MARLIEDYADYAAIEDYAAAAQKAEAAETEAAKAAAEKEAAEHVGMKVRKRDHGKDWTLGFITQLQPLKVTASHTDPSAQGWRYDEVKDLSGRLLDDQYMRLKLMAEKDVKAPAPALAPAQARRSQKMLEMVYKQREKIEAVFKEFDENKQGTVSDEE
eukprot:COSAG01_NODE_24565_length_774_cov_2.241481_1_plen_158_part_10